MSRSTPPTERSLTQRPAPAHDAGAPVTVLIADDEPVARAGLRDMLGGIGWVRVVGEAANGPAAVDAINALRPEVALLDIEMPGLLGTDVLRRVSHVPYVIFTTAYAQHAVTAFELGALDYLLKPFGPARLAAALERVRAAVGEPNASPALDRLREALAAGPMTRLFVRAGAAVVPVNVADVSRFEAWGDYVRAYTARGRHVLHLSLNRLEERLDASRFMRIHRAHLVNLDAVRAFRRAGKGQLEAEMTDGSRVPVSRGRARALRDRAV